MTVRQWAEQSRRFHLNVRLPFPSSYASAQSEPLPHRLAVSYKNDGEFPGACPDLGALGLRRIHTGLNDVHSCHTPVLWNHNGSFVRDCQV